MLPRSATCRTVPPITCWLINALLLRFDTQNFKWYTLERHSTPATTTTMYIIATKLFCNICVRPCTMCIYIFVLLFFLVFIVLHFRNGFFFGCLFCSVISTLPLFAHLIWLFWFWFNEFRFVKFTVCSKLQRFIPEEVVPKIKTTIMFTTWNGLFIGQRCY